MSVIPNPKPAGTDSSNNERTTIRKVPDRAAYLTPSIMDALKDEPKQVEMGKVAESNTNQYIRNKTVHPFSREELVEAWKIFVTQIDTPQLKSALIAREPRLADNWQIEYELDTELQYNRLTTDLKPKLQDYLRRQFVNEEIGIVFTVSKGNSQQAKVPYTDAEKWELLVDKYPALATLKSKFGLDFEHY